MEFEDDHFSIQKTKSLSIKKTREMLIQFLTTEKQQRPDVKHLELLKTLVEHLESSETVDIKNRK